MYGKDTNPGTASEPFQNLTAVPQIRTGQSIGLACETPPAHWRQWLYQAQNSPSNATITGYPLTGSGACTTTAQIAAGTPSNLPIIDGADVITTGWTPTSGYPNVYQTKSALTFATTCGGAGGDPYFSSGCATSPPYSFAQDWENVWEDDGSAPDVGGKFLIYETSISAVNSTPCSYYVPNLITTGATTNDGVWAIPPAGVLYIHGCNAAHLNPSTNGYVYDYSNRVYEANLYGTGNTYQYFEGRKASWGNGAITSEPSNGSDTYNNIISRDYAETGIGATGGSTVENCIFIDGFFPNATGFGGSSILWYEDNGASGLNGTVKNNIFQQDQSIGGSSVNSMSVLFAQIVGGGTEGALTFSDNWIIQKNYNGYGAVAAFGTSWASWSLSTNYWTNVIDPPMIDPNGEVRTATLTGNYFYDTSDTNLSDMANGMTTGTSTMCSGSWCGPTVPNVQ